MPFAYEEESVEELMPFNIAFDKKGNPIVMGSNGKKLKANKVEFPIKATAIESVDSITMVQYRGSHVKLLKTSGGWYAIPLPH